MSVNLEGLSSKELAELISRASQRKKVLARRKPANQVKAAVAKFLTSVGWNFDELYGTGKAGAAKPDAAAPTAGTPRAARKVAPKYRTPANAKETWAGRGKQPRWLAAETSKGRKLEDFLIK